MLSGEGGDEAFGGYHTYRNFSSLERLKSALGPFEGLLAPVLSALAHMPLLGKCAQIAPFATRAVGDYYYSRAASPFSFFNRNKEIFYSPGFRETVNEGLSLQIIRELFGRVRSEPALNQMQYVDVKTSLPDDLLVKADKMTMANSLELRVPFLDHVVMEFAASLPPSYRVKGLATKRVLKQAFQTRIPKEIIKRKKAGFPIPIETWMRYDLSGPVREILLSRACIDRGYFKKSAVENLLSLGGRGFPVSKEIFSLLTLELLHLEFADFRTQKASTASRAASVH